MQASEIRGLLPWVFQRAAQAGAVEGAASAAPLPTLLEAMARMLDPIDERLASIDAAFDPARTDAAMVALLARWVDLERLYDERGERAGELATGTDALRRLIAEALTLARTRGTRAGLVRSLELATGLRGFRIDEPALDADGRAASFEVWLHTPKLDAATAALVARIVEQEKPAHVLVHIAADARADAERAATDGGSA